MLIGALGIVSTAILTASTPDVEVSVPQHLSEPVLIARQSGIDVAWTSPAAVDYPNAAWGIEVLIPTGRVFRTAATAAPDLVWKDLATIPRAEAQLYRKYSEGLSLYRSREVERAKEAWMDAAVLASGLGLREMALHARYLRATAFVRLGQHDGAVEELKELVEFEPEDRFSLYVKYALGSALYRSGHDLDEARAVLSEVIAEANRRGDSYNWIVGSRQFCYTHLQNDERMAAECLETLILDPRVKEHPTIEATIVNTYARSLDKLGESDRAHELLLELLELRLLLGNERGTAATLQAIADSNRRQGRTIEALRYYLDSYERYRRLGAHTHELNAEIALGELYLELGDMESAELWFRHSLNTVTDLAHDRAFALLGLARVQIASEDYEGAHQSLELVSGAADYNVAVRAEATATQLLLLEASGASISAEMVEAAISAASQWGNPRYVAHGRLMRAKMLAREGRWAEAKSDIDAALAPIAKVGTRAGATLLEADRLRALDDTAMMSKLEGAIALEAERLQETPAWQARSRTTEGIWQRALRWTAEQPASVTRDAQLWSLDSTRRRLGNVASEKGLAFADRNVSAMDVLSQAAREAMAAKAVNIDQLQALARLDAAEASSPVPALRNTTPSVPTLSYWLDAVSSVVMFHDGVAPVARALPATAIERIEAMIDTSNQGVFDEATLRQASDALIGPIRDLLPRGGPLNIAVDGFLAAVAFELLFVDDRRTVLDAYEIAYVHDPLSKAPTRVEGGNAAVLVAPDYAGQMPALSSSLGEARLVEGAFAETLAVSGGAATREALAGLEGRRLNVLHLGVHARASVEWSAWSGLWLSGPEFVSAREIAASHYPIDLVFLSACSTSVGSMEISGTTQSLALAWLMAGSSSVISTLWDVSDAGAYEFSSVFYENVQSQGLRAAVAAAKRALVNSGIWADPRYWASFQLWVG